MGLKNNIYHKQYSTIIVYLNPR